MTPAQLLQRVEELRRSSDDFAQAVMPEGEMAYVRYTKNAEQLFSALHEALHLTELKPDSIAYNNWQTTLKVQLDNPGVLQSANLTTLQQCYLFLRRAERFNDGIWLQALTSGLLSAIAQRLIALERPRLLVQVLQLLYAALPIVFIIAFAFDLLFSPWSWLARFDQMLFAGLALVPLAWLGYLTWRARAQLPTAPVTLIVGALGPLLSYSLTIVVQHQWSIHLFASSGMIYIIALSVGYVFNKKTISSYHWLPFIPSAIVGVWCFGIFYHLYVDLTFNFFSAGFFIRQAGSVITLGYAIFQATKDFRQLFLLSPTASHRSNHHQQAQSTRQ